MSKGNRYSKVAVFIHWLAAVCIISNLILGHIMELPYASKRILVPFHAWIGLTILLLTVIRIAWRLGHPKPPYDFSMTRFETLAASFTQAAFYVLMLAIPIVGYLILSANPPNPARHLTFWGVIPVPFLSGLQNLDPVKQHLLHDQLVNVHALGSWFLLSLLILHLGGVFKHLVFDKVNVLRRMRMGS